MLKGLRALLVMMNPGGLGRKRTKSESESELEKDYFVRTIEQHKVADITLDFFYTPHTLSLLVGVIFGLLLLAMRSSRRNPTGSNDKPSTTLPEDLYHAAICVTIIFLFISMLIMPNGPFTRPHPAVWRIVFGASLLYFLTLVGTLFLKFEDARRILHWLDPSLTNMTVYDILDKEYAVNCSHVTPSRVWSHLDGFALAHFLGWLAKAVLLRHYFITWTLSINWEITELAFAHILPNFAECWWDQIILDILMCNGIGIFIGMKICQWLEMRDYHWASIRHIQSATGKIKRVVLQFTPHTWTPTRWLDNDSGPMRVAKVCQLVVLWQVAELNSFFLKHIFIVKPSNPLTLARLTLVTVMSGPAIRQYYLYTVDPNVKRVGSQLWLFVAVLLTETIVCIRFGKELFERAILQYIVGWFFYLIVSSVVFVYISALVSRRRQTWEEEQHLKTNDGRTPSPVVTRSRRMHSSRTNGSLEAKKVR